MHGSRAFTVILTEREHDRLQEIAAIRLNSLGNIVAALILEEHRRIASHNEDNYESCKCEGAD